MWHVRVHNHNQANLSIKESHLDYNTGYVDTIQALGISCISCWNVFYRFFLYAKFCAVKLALILDGDTHLQVFAVPGNFSLFELLEESH